MTSKIAHIHPAKLTSGASEPTRVLLVVTKAGINCWKKKNTEVVQEEAAFKEISLDAAVAAVFTWQEEQRTKLKAPNPTHLGKVQSGASGQGNNHTTFVEGFGFVRLKRVQPPSDAPD